MIRPFTLICALLAAGSGLSLYQIKHQAQLRDQEIRHLREATDATLTRAGLLRAEYQLLNDPERLESLASQYLPNLRSTDPKQWASMADLDRRLPPVGTPEAEPPAPLEPEATPVARAEPAAEPVRPVAAVAATPAPRQEATTPGPVVASVHVAPHPMALAARPTQPIPVAAAAHAATRAQVARNTAVSSAPTPLWPPRAAPSAQFASQAVPVYAAARPAIRPTRLRAAAHHDH